MKPAPFDYYVPTTIDEACRLLTDAGGGATILAGGQTLLPLLALRMSQPFVVVDVNRIAALKGTSRVDGSTRIGALTRQNEVIADTVLAAVQPLIVTATRHVGHHQTRNRGTIGGSIALGEPAAELPATALALGASVEVRSARGSRRIALEELYLGPYLTSLEPDELLTAVLVPEWPSRTRWMFREVSRRPGDFALVGLTGAITIKDGCVERAGIAWFGMGPTPIKARQVETALLGQSIDGLNVDALAEVAVGDTLPFDDLHATAAYRRLVGMRVFTKLLAEATSLRQAA